MILHIPHSSRLVPYQVRGQFVLSDEELELELTRMTDAHTDEIFIAEGAAVVKFPVSRLIVDVERFANDADEPMSKVGMGKIPTKTSQGKELRPQLKPNEISDLITEYYEPHHQALQAAVEGELMSRGRALIIDCHSFPSQPLPCDQDRTVPRPDFCLGTDLFHTPIKLADLVVSELQKTEYKVDLNCPYSGAIVPMKFYGKNARVSSIMIEINRRLYMDEATGGKIGRFYEIRDRIRGALGKMVKLWHELWI